VASSTRRFSVLGRLCGKIVRMSVASSEAARALSAARWGAQRPRRLAAELVRRVSELPASERAALRKALEDN
jgi:hypothetical protein